MVGLTCVAACLAVMALLHGARALSSNGSEAVSIAQSMPETLSKTPGPEDESHREQSLEQRRARLNDSLDEMSRTGSPDDPVMKTLRMRIDATSTGLVEALASDAPLDEVQRNAVTMELLTESMRTYANIEQSRARFVLNRLLRRVREPEGPGLGQIPEAKLLEAEKLLQYSGPEQPFFDKAREQWQELQAALRLDESDDQALPDIDLDETTKLVEAAGLCGRLCRLIATAEALRFTPGALPFDELMKKEGIDEELVALRKTFVENETVDMERLMAVASKLQALVVRAMAAEESDADADEPADPEE